MAITIFLCYAPQDESLLQKLKAHLRVFEHQGHITLWDRGGIQPGAVWEQEVRKHLDEAQIILLLLSSSFMASYYQYTMEVRYAVVRHERQEARVIPILLRPVLWQIPPVVITRAEALLLR